MDLEKMLEGFLKATKDVIEKAAENTPCYSDMFPGEDNILSFDLETVGGKTMNFAVKDYYCLADGCDCNSVLLKIFDEDGDLCGECKIAWHKTYPDQLRSFRLDSGNVNSFFSRILGPFFMHDVIGEENKLLEVQKRYAHVRQCVDAEQENSQKVTYH